MQLADSRGNNESSFSSSAIKSFLSETDSSASPPAFRTTSLPQSLIRSGKTAYLLPINQKDDFILADTVPLILHNDAPNLQTDEYNHVLDATLSEKSRISSQAEPTSIFPYCFPSDSKEHQSCVPETSKELLPRICDPYLILTSSYASTTDYLSQYQSLLPETKNKEESSTFSLTENVLNNSFPYSKSRVDYKLPQGVFPCGVSDAHLQSNDLTNFPSKDVLSCRYSSKIKLQKQTSKVHGFSQRSQERSPYKNKNKLVRLQPSRQDVKATISHLVRTKSTSLQTITSSAIQRELRKTGLKLTNKSSSTTPSINVEPVVDVMECRITRFHDHEQSINDITTCRSGKDGSGKNRGDVKEKDTATNSRHSSMYQTFQNWAIKNYGDSGKTKTVTMNKYLRIVRILTGEEQFTAENSKFRFWVKAKGFRLSTEDEEFQNGTKILLVPSKLMNDEPDESSKPFKRVAVVENFFDIIYNVHVEMDGRGGKHAGQKRTYRAIAETYSFLPREAVTRFLMSCTDCQKRMQLSMESNNNSTSAEDRNEQQDDSLTLEHTNVVDDNNPVTQSYMGHTMDSKTTQVYELSDHDDESVSSFSAMSRETSPSVREARVSGECTEERNYSAEFKSSNNNKKEPALEVVPDMTTARRMSPQAMETENRATDSSPEELPSRKTSPIPGKVTEVKGHPERKRRASSESGDSAMTKTSEGKEDEDEDDNDEDEKILVGQNIDPERLKAFNMFVRLFVDENLDRMVPISKQPKDKIQAILEACDRQFPEFHERSRKRIRTYLKSCRRMRRSKEHNGWEPLRPTPPHLTSAAAESLLATACENESQNAKRMRLGLEPLPASAMVSHNTIVTSQTPPSTQPSSQPQPQSIVTQTPSQPSNLSSPRSINCSVPAATDFLRSQPPPPTFRTAPEFTPSFFTNGHGAALFRPGFSSYQHPAHHQQTILPHAPITANATTNGEFGPTDLSMKKSNNKGQLSPSEVTAIKQLIAGYRESAAFLYRSADELEQLLLQQN